MKLAKPIKRQIEAPLPACCPTCGEKPRQGRDAQTWNAIFRAEGIELRALRKRRQRFFVPWRDVLNAALRRGFYTGGPELAAAATTEGGAS